MSFDALKKLLLQAVKQKGLQVRRRPRQIRSHKIASFLRNLLQEREISREKLSTELDMELELVDAILDGILPPSEFNDDLLDELASVLQCSSAELKKLLDL